MASARIYNNRNSLYLKRIASKFTYNDYLISLVALNNCKSKLIVNLKDELKNSNVETIFLKTGIIINRACHDLEFLNGIVSGKTLLLVHKNGMINCETIRYINSLNPSVQLVCGKIGKTILSPTLIHKLSCQKTHIQSILSNSFNITNILKLSLARLFEQISVTHGGVAAFTYK